MLASIGNWQSAIGNTLAALSLTTSAMLLGASLVALPIAAHLLFRKARRRVTFPTVRLLAEATAAQSSVFHLRRVLVLIARCLVVVLLALAFARPVWVDAGTQDAGAGVDLAIVVDNSASSDQRVDGVRAIERVRAAALAELDALTPGRDRATVIYAERTPRADYPEPIPNLDALRSDLRAMSPTQERADLSSAIAMGAAVLADAEGARRLVVVSDMQRTNWQDVKIDAKLLGESRIAARIVPAGDRAAGNVALLAPRLAPARPAVAMPATASVTVANFTPEERAVTVRAAVDGVSVGSRRVSVAPGASVAVAFPVVFASAAQHRVRFDTDPDDLPADDDAHLVADAVERVNVVLVGDDDADAPRGASYFLLRALAPAGADDRVAVRFLRGPAVTADALADAEVIVIGDAARLSAESAEAIADALLAGRGVLYFACAGAAAANVPALTDAPPWTLGPLREPGARGAAVHLRDGAFDLPPLNTFADPQQLALQRVDFLRYHALRELAPDASVLLRFDDADHTPALAISEHGPSRGRLALANFSPAPAASDLAVRPMFVPLLHALLDHLRPRRDAAGVMTTVGTPLTWTLEAPRSARLQTLGPDRKPVPLRVDREGDRASVRVATPVAGVYTLLRDAAPVRQAAINIDPRESDLARIDPALLAEHLGNGSDGAGAIAIDTADDERAAALAGGTPWWPALVVAAIAALAVEMLLIGVYRR